MSAGYGPLEVPSWAIGVVFTFFLVVTLIWDKLLHATEHWLHHRNKPALDKVLHSLKDEILAVGLIVLILPLFENHLMKVCIPEAWAIKAPGYTPHGWDFKPADVPAPYTPAEAYPPPSTPELAAPAPHGAPDVAAAVPPATSGDHAAAAPDDTAAAASHPAAPAPATADHGAQPPADHAATSPSDHAPSATGRRLLAAPAAGHGQSADGAGKSGSADETKAKAKEKAPVCGPGWTQLFPAEAHHGIHIFIALTALVHVFFACVCLGFCVLRMRLWWPWEVEAQRSPAIPTSKRIIKSVGKSKFLHILMSIANTFILPINRPLYLSMRRLFLEGLKDQARLQQLPMDFPYHDYVKEAMQYSFCDIIAVSPLVWLFAIVQLIIPVTARIYGTIALCSIAIILMVAAGAKLHSIVVHLAARSCFLYSNSGYSTDTLPEDAELGRPEDLSGPHDQVLFGTSIAAGSAVNVGREAPVGGLRAKYQGVKNAMHHDTPHKAPSFKKLDNLPANVVHRFKTYAVRAKTDQDLPSMFWFHRPWLLLMMFKVAYFQAAFCLTLVLFALWKDNQFLPEQHMTAPVVTFFVLLAINIAMSFFTSASMLPVYAIVSVADKTAFATAAEFAARAIRHQKSLELELRPDAVPQLAEHEHQAAMEVLQKLQSHVGKMQKLVDGVQAFKATAKTGDTLATSRTTSTAGSALPPSGVQSPQYDALSPAASALTSWQSSVRTSLVSSPRNRGANLWGSVRAVARH